VVTVGSYHGQGAALALGEEYHRNGITLVSSMTVNGCAHRQAPRWDLPRLDATARRLIETGALPVTELITHRVPFAHAESAYRLVAEQPETTIKVVLTYEP
jgi:threonine dehydrogenase-like Zn-dependent dehydrogenase